MFGRVVSHLHPSALYIALSSHDLMTSSQDKALVAQHSDIVYETALLFWRTVTNIFFREIRPRGAFNIPSDGPVIFVAAPHHNQVSAAC